MFWQVVPKLEGVDELLSMPLDEECLQRLLSGEGLDEDGPVVSLPSLCTQAIGIMITEITVKWR